MKEEYYSLAQVAQICNRDKSTISRKLNKSNLENMKNLISPQIVKRNGYNNKEQLFFNEYAVKYIISLCYKNLDYYQIEDINLNDLQKYYLDKNKKSRGVSNIDYLNHLIINDSNKLDILDALMNVKNELNDLKMKNALLISKIEMYEEENDKIDAFASSTISEKDKEIEFLKEQVLKSLNELKKDDLSKK